MLNICSRAHATHSLTNFSCHGQALRVSDRGELLVSQPLNGVLVISQIQLSAHQDDGCVGAVMSHLGVPLQEEDRVRGCRMHTDNTVDCVECGWVAKRTDFFLSFLLLAIQI